MENLLNRKIALITGGDRGIGRAVTERYIAEGAYVAVHYHTGKQQAESILNSHPGKVSIFPADLSDLDATIQLHRSVISRLGTIDILVNNAGVAIHSEPFADTLQWINDWKRTLDINLNAVAILCNLAIKHFLEKGKEGKIINIASRAAFNGDTAEYMAYAASKGGVVALTRSLARAYGKKNIVAFTVAPGFVETDMAQQFIDEYGKNYVLSGVALNRLTRPEDLAPLIAFLASGQADHATGGTFDMNAGSYVH